MSSESQSSALSRTLDLSSASQPSRISHQFSDAESTVSLADITAVPVVSSTPYPTLARQAKVGRGESSWTLWTLGRRPSFHHPLPGQFSDASEGSEAPPDIFDVSKAPQVATTGAQSGAALAALKAARVKAETCLDGQLKEALCEDIKTTLLVALILSAGVTVSTVLILAMTCTGPQVFGCSSMSPPSATGLPVILIPFRYSIFQSNSFTDSHRECPQSPSLISEGQEIHGLHRFPLVSMICIAFLVQNLSICSNVQ